MNLVVDLDKLEGYRCESIKISSIKLPENVTPTIKGRDFVVATLAAPTIIKEPEKPAEETAEEGVTEGAEAEETKAAEGAEKAKAERLKLQKKKKKKVKKKKIKKPAAEKK